MSLFNQVEPVESREILKYANFHDPDILVLKDRLLARRSFFLSFAMYSKMAHGVIRLFGSVTIRGRILVLDCMF